MLASAMLAPTGCTRPDNLGEREERWLYLAQKQQRRGGMAAKFFFALLFLGVANVTQGLVCRKDGARFSSKVSTSHFYECE